MSNNGSTLIFISSLNISIRLTVEGDRSVQGRVMGIGKMWGGELTKTNSV